MQNVETWTQLEPPLPPPPLFKGGQDLPKTESLVGGGGVRNFLLERGDKPVKGGLPLFYYFTVQSYVCVGKVKFPLLLFSFSVFLSQLCKILIQVLIVLKHWYISDSFQQCTENVDCFIEINLEYTENYMDKFFEHQGTMFLHIQKVVVKIGCGYLLVFFHIFGKRCQIFIDL